MSHVSDGTTFTTDASGAVRTARAGQRFAAPAPEPEIAQAELKTGGPIIPTPVRVVIYAVGTPVAAAASFIAGTDVFGPVVSTVAGAVAAAAVAAVGTTALGNLNR